MRRRSLARTARFALALSVLAWTTAAGCFGMCRGGGQLKPITPQVARYHQQGMTQLADGHPRQAVESFELALKIQPLYVPSKAHLGLARHRLGQNDAALQELLHTVEVLPDYADTYNYMGFVYEAKGDQKRAEDAYSSAIDTYPGYDDAHYNRAQLYEKQARYAEALDDYKTAAVAAAANEKSPTARVLVARANAAIGMIYVRNGIKRDAEQHFQIAIDTGVPIPEAHYGLGRIHYLNEKWLDTILAFHEALKIKDEGWVRPTDLDACKRGLRHVHGKAPDYVAKQLVELATERYEELYALSQKERKKIAALDYDHIKRLLYSAEEIDPKLIDIAIFKGRIYLDEGEVNKAGRVALDALKIDPTNADARYLLASIYITRARERERKREKGSGTDWAKAEAVLRELRREDSSRFKYHNTLGVVYFAQNKARQAGREWREALRCEAGEAQKQIVVDNLAEFAKKPIIKKANELNDAGREALKNADLDQARALFKQALAYDSQFAVAQVNLALTELEADNLDLAIETIEAALELDPDLHSAHLVRGRVHYVQGQPEPARARFEDAHRLFAGDPEPLYWLGRLAYDHERPDLTKNYIRQALALAPEHFPCLVLRARIHRDEGEHGEADTLLQLATDISEGQYQPAFVALAELYIEMERYEDAATQAEQAAGLKPADPEPWILFARAWEALGKPAVETSRAYVQAAQLYDAKAQIYETQGLRDEAKGLLDKAVEMAERAVKLDPTPMALDRLGLFVAKTGDHNRGISYLREALRKDETFLLARFDIGTVYEGMGELELAAESYRKCVQAVEIPPDPKDPVVSRGYWEPRMRLGFLYQPGVRGVVDRAEAIRVLQEAMAVAAEPWKSMTSDRLKEIQ